MGNRRRPPSWSNNATLVPSSTSLIPAVIPAKVNFTSGGRNPTPVPLRVQLPPGRMGHGLSFPQSNPDIIRFYFRRLCATLRVKQER